jgi:signal transduction histidine kinase
VGYNFRKVILDNYIQIEAQNIELINHRENLEKLVKERTEELETVNEELKSTNEELFEKNRIISDQNVELKTTLEHLKETQLQLMQSEKMASLGILTAGVAHEINNPLNFIVGGINGLENYLIKPENYSPEKIATLLGSIKIGVERTSAIVQSLNQFSRNNDSFQESYDIHTILESCLLMLNNKTKHRIEIVKDYFTETIPMIGNVGKLHQVFINILNNSIQSIDNEGSINIRTRKIEQNVIIEITDTGCGISTENISKITDPFFTTKDPGKGTGLGLSITYKIIQEHSGIIEFQSEINKGTIVKVTLPILEN